MSTRHEILEKVFAYADTSHNNQQRKYSGEKYMVHPNRVMERCSLYTDNICILSAALLHDVLEDTPVTEADLLSFLKTIMRESDALQTLQIVVELTDIFTTSSHKNLNRKKRKALEAERLSKVSGDAQTIKYADIIDNTDVTYNEPEFAKKYLQEAIDLLNVMDRGNENLRTAAIQRVTACIRSLQNTAHTA